MTNDKPDDDLERVRREKDARSEHKRRYWSVVDRSSYRCPDCGRKASHPDIWRMEIHHKDRDPFNGDMDNLVALCHHCHMQRHGKRAREDLNDWKMKGINLGGMEAD